jgi:hypothetical protein
MAAVCGFFAVINGEKVVGVVKAKDEAFEAYDNAIAEGKGAYLLEEGFFLKVEKEVIFGRKERCVCYFTWECSPWGECYHSDTVCV